MPAKCRRPLSVGGQLMAALDECDDAGLWTRTQPVRGGGRMGKPQRARARWWRVKAPTSDPSGPTGGRVFASGRSVEIHPATGQGFVDT